MHPYVSMCKCAYAFTHMYANICKHICMHACMCACLCVCMYVCMYLCLYACLCVCVCFVHTFHEAQIRYAHMFDRHLHLRQSEPIRVDGHF